MAEAAFDYRDFDEEERIEIPDGGIADFLTAKTGSWATPSFDAPPSGIGSVKKIGDHLAEFGRFDDAYMAHLAPNETVVPAAVLDLNPRLKAALHGQMRAAGVDPARYTVGDDANSINPVTGQREFGWFSDRWKALKGGIKKVFRVVKRVLPKVLPVILAFTPLGPILGPMVGSGIGTLMEGGDWKDALKASAITGATAGIMRGIQGGVEGMQSGTGFFEGAGQTVGGDLSNIGARFGQATGISALPQGQSYWSMPSSRTLVEPVENVASGSTAPVLESYDPTVRGLEGFEYRSTPPVTEADFNTGWRAFSQDGIGDVPKQPPGPPINTGEGAPIQRLISRPPDSQGSLLMSSGDGTQGSLLTDPGYGTGTIDPSYASLLADPGYGTGTKVDPRYARFLDGSANRAREDALIAKMEAIPEARHKAPGFFKSIGQAVDPRDDVGFMQGMRQAFLPRNATPEEILSKINVDWKDATPGLRERATALADKIKDPNFIRRFGPIYGTSMLLAALQKPPENEDAEGFIEEGSDMWDRLTENPGKYEPRMNLPQQYAIQQWAGTGTGAQPSIRWQTGATAARGGDVDAYPPRIGAISGPGTETSDDVPAMLSDGEFVFTAKSVRGAGGGSRQNGTQNLYNLMRNFEGRV